MGAFNPGPATGSVRPPTPPKESTSKLPNGDDPNSFSNSANRPLLDTPDESPSSSAEYYKASAERSQKKVGFSPWTEFHKLPMTGNKDSDSEGSIRRLPPSKDCKSLKSILKACKDNTTTDFENQLPAFDQTNLVTMLNSAIQHLKAPTNKSRTEAYVALLACLSAYDDAPETTDMSEIVSEFTGYIRRDICAKAESDDGLDTQLATQALKVLTVLLCTPSIATVLPEDFCSFILERSLTSIEDASSPKILVAHYMHLLEKQKFTVKVMTTERVNRLLTGLDLVTNRIKGNRVVCHRLMIYQRLMTQAKSVMSSRVGSWIDHLISGMLSSIKDVRVRAIAFGLEAGLQLGTTSSVSHSCIDVFNRASPEGKRVVDFLSSRLLEMVGSKEDGVHVPQIWSIIILFFRSRRRQLECWEHIKAWLVIIQRCLNSSDPQVKLQANIAWSRLIFVINLDTSTSVSMAKMLRQPLVPQLERRTSDKTSKQAKGLARSTYCTLLYYAFRPTATTLQIGQYWDLYIAQILPKSFTAGKSDVNYACDIFAALLSSNGKPRMWDENRANVNGPVKPDELPCIDSKWVRSKSVKIIQIFETLFDLADWKMNKDYEAPLLLAWRSFVTAIGTASSKEVKVSMDTMNAVSQIINLLKRLLEKRSQQQESDRRDPKDLFYKINRLTQEAVAKIGSIPFLERRIVLTSHNSFEAAETPSNRSIKDSSSLNSPATHLLHLLFTHAQNCYRTTAYPDAVKAVMHISLQSANTRRAQLGAIRNLARLLSTTRAFDRQACTIFWRLLAEATCSSLKIPRHSDPYNASPQYPGHEIREAVKILDIGIQQRSGEIVPAWLELYDCIASSLRQEIGNDAINLLMIYPLADIMKDCSGTCDDALLILSAALLKNVHWPQSHQLTERAEKMLWGVTHTPHRKKSDTLFNVFYMSNALLCSAYVCLTQLSAEVVVAFLSSVVNAIGSCPPEHQETMLSQMQPGLAAWIEDPDGLLRSSANGLSLKVEKLFAKVITIIEGLSDHSTRLLFKIHQILLSSLRSRHESILNKSIGMWNRTFGCVEALEYPEDMRKALLRLRFMTDIQTPTFPEAEKDEAASSPIRFVCTQDSETELHRLPSVDLPIKAAKEIQLCQDKREPTALALSLSPRLATNSPLVGRREGKTTPRARLRHDDSQIQLAAVESSPLAPEPVDSQHLTDRQKEVKERQTLEAAMFPEIQSSPKSAPRRAEYSLPKLVFKSDEVSAAKAADDEQTTPVYPPDALMNVFLGSSPTPASNKKGISQAPFDDGPPSSPPMLPTYPKIGQETILPPVADSAAQSTVTDRKHEQNESCEMAIEDTSDTTTHLTPSEKRSDAEQAPPSSNDGEQSSQLAVQADKQDDCIMSDSDVFIDAPSDPTKIILATEPDNASTSFNPLQSGNSPPQPSESDQVTAQLVGEMERASSQRSSKEDQATKPAQTDGKKRKRTSSDAVDVRKKARGTPASSDPQHVSESPKAREFVAECVLINVRNVRQGEGNAVANLPQIKRERSQSPCLIENLPLEEETLATKDQNGRRTGKSRTSQLSQEALPVVGSPQQRKRKQRTDVDDASMANATENSIRKSARLTKPSTSSPRRPIPSPSDIAVAEPRSVTKIGRRRASMRWFWRSEESRDDNGQSSANPNVPSANTDDADVATRHDQPERSQQLAGEPEPAGQGPRDGNSGSSPTKQTNKVSQSEAIDTEPSAGSPSADGILQGFRKMLNNIKRVALGREEEREMIGILFESVKEVHEAGRRNTAT